jgi:hypothetical protein
MKLEAGKRYRQRSGLVTGRLTSGPAQRAYPFWDDVNGLSYTVDGIWTVGTDDKNDLICEVDPTDDNLNILRPNSVAYPEALKAEAAHQDALATLAGGTKHDSGKPPLSLIPRVALEAEARVFDFGAKKYARYNYTKGFNVSRLIDAAMRHLVAYNDGEDLDPESGESHLAHARCCTSMLMECLNLGTATDDRRVKPKKETV